MFAFNIKSQQLIGKKQIHMKINRNTIRWVLLLPMLLLTSFIALFLVMQLSIISIGIPSDVTQLNFWFSIGGGVTAIVWILTSYLMAPNHKIITIWIILSVGFVFIGVSLLLNLDSIKKGMILHHWVLSFLSAIICGFILTVFLHYLEFNKKMNNTNKQI